MDDTPVVAGSPRIEPAAATPFPAVALIAAMARNRVIGANNRMPWHLSVDLKRFRALTTGHRIVMGRKTFASLGKPLPGRENVVVTRDAGFDAAGCVVVHALEEALAGLTLPPPIFCIGGAQLYAAALPLASEIWLTEIDAAFDGDTFMPPFSAAEWQTDSREAAVDAQSGLPYAFVHLSRIRPAAPATAR